jgi:hypothetical protein
MAKKQTGGNVTSQMEWNHKVGSHMGGSTMDGMPNLDTMFCLQLTLLWYFVFWLENKSIRHLVILLSFYYSTLPTHKVIAKVTNASLPILNLPPLLPIFCHPSFPCHSCLIFGLHDRLIFIIFDQPCPPHLLSHINRLTLKLLCMFAHRLSIAIKLIFIIPILCAPLCLTISENILLVSWLYFNAK